MDGWMEWGQAVPGFDVETDGRARSVCRTPAPASLFFKLNETKPQTKRNETGPTSQPTARFCHLCRPDADMTAFHWVLGSLRRGGPWLFEKGPQPTVHPHVLEDAGTHGTVGMSEREAMGRCQRDKNASFSFLCDQGKHATNVPVMAAEGCSKYNLGGLDGYTTASLSNHTRPHAAGSGAVLVSETSRT